MLIDRGKMSMSCRTKELSRLRGHGEVGHAVNARRSTVRRWLLIVLVAVGLSLAASGSGVAQSVLPAEAEKALQRGVLAAQQSQWTVALRYFEEARKAAPYEPRLLFNTGLAESKLPGRELRAIAWLRAYLAASPGAANEKAVRELIEALEVRVEGAIEKILREARDLALRIPPGFERNRAVQKVGEAQAAMGDFAAAKETVARMAPDDQSGPGRVAGALAKAGDVAGAKQMVAGIAKDDYFIYRSSAYADIAVTQAVAGDLAGAEATLDEAKRSGDRIRGLFGVAHVLVAAGRQAEATTWVNRARDAIAALDPGARAGYYAWLGKMQAAVDDVAAALQTASLLPEERPAGTGDNRADVVASVHEAYRRRFDERLKAGDLIEARRLLGKITASGVRSDAYWALYQNRLAAHDWDDALRAISEVADSDFRKADNYVYLAMGFVRAGDRARARQAIDGAKRVVPFVFEGHKPEVLHKLADVQADAGDFAGAKQTIAGMQKGDAYDKALASVAWRQLAAGDLAAARETLSMTSTPKAWPYQRLAEAEVAAGDLAGALTHAASINLGRADMYDRIVRAQLEHGQLDAARATVPRIGRPARADLALSSIAEWQADQGDAPGALATADRITDEWIRLIAYLPIARLQITTGYARAAAATAARAKTLVENMQDPARRVAGYSSLEDFWRHYVGSLAQARQMVAEARRVVASTADPAKRVDLLLRLAAPQRATMLWTDSRQSLLLATETAASIAPGPTLDAAYESIASAQADAGDFAGACETAARVASGSDPDCLLTRQISRQISRAKRTGRVEALRDVLGVLKNEGARNSVRADLAKLLAQQGDRTGAAQTAAAIPAGTYGRDEVYYAVALAHAKAGDVAAARSAVAQIAKPIRSSDLFFAIARGGDIQWVEQKLWLLHEDTRPLVRAQLAGLRAARGDVASATAILGTSASLAAKAAVCEGILTGADVRAVSECAAKLPTPGLRVPVMLRLAEISAERGDVAGARTILSGLASGRPGARLLLRVARAQVAIGDASGAGQTLELVHPNDAEFEPWARYVIATSQPATKIAEGIALAKAIPDPSWRDRALLALLPNATDAPAAEALLGAIIDPLTRLQGRHQLVWPELRARGVTAALKQAEQLTDPDARADALGGMIAWSARPEARGPAVEQAAMAMPDRAAKVYVLLDLARARVAAGDAPAAASVLHAAETAVRAMTEPFWQVRAYANVAEVARQAGATAIAESAMRLARTTADRLPADEKTRWLAFVNRPPATASVAQTRTAMAATDRTKKWTQFVERELSARQFTDLAGRLQSIAAESKSKDMVDKLVGTADALIGKSKEIKAQAAAPGPR